MSSFVVRFANSLDDFRWVVENANLEGWGPRVNDAEYLFALDFSKYFFIGELDGERVSCLSIVKYGEDYAFVGYYIVSKPHRGKGYGLRTWKYAFEASALSEQCNVGLDSLVNMETTYAKDGFERVWVIRRYAAVVSNVAEALSDVRLPIGLKIVPGPEVDVNKLAEYDKSIFDAYRQMLVASWITISAVSFVALNEKTEIVGYIILRRTIKFEESGYRLSPLFADSLVIAQSLLKKSIEAIGRDHFDKKVNFEIPLEGNAEGVEFVQSVQNVTSSFETVHMYTKGFRTMDRKKVFSVANLEIG
jgi:hypothetical protein